MKKQKSEWPSEMARENYFSDLHFRIIDAQHKAIQKMLDEDPKLTEKFVALWKEIDPSSFILNQDPEYNEWLKEDEFVIEEANREETIIERKRKLDKDIIKP